MEKKKIGLTSIAVMIAVASLVLFQFIAMIDAYTGGNQFGPKPPFDITPIGSLIMVLAWSLLTVLFLFKKKPFLAAIVISFSLLIDRGMIFIRSLLNNSLDFSTTAGFGVLIIFGAMVFLIIAVILERKHLEMPGKGCIFKTPFLILILTYIGYRLVFANVAVTIAAVVLLFIVAGFDEEPFLPLVIAAFTVMTLFLLIDDFIDLANNTRVSNVSLISHIIGTLILGFAILMYFMPNLFEKKQAQPAVSEKVNDEVIASDEPEAEVEEPEADEEEVEKTVESE